jgi:hypothetical protein
MRRKNKCLHVIGMYFHSSSELHDFCTVDGIDGLGDIAGYYEHCHKCGAKITKEIIEKQMKMKRRQK